MPSIKRDDASTDAAPPLPDKSKFTVGDIPFQDDPHFQSLKQYAGQIPMQGDKDVMFFWLVANATNTQNQDKLLIWLNGGPGCTSLDGLFMENGPYKFDGPNRLKFRDYSLTQQFDVLYIDQPFGTGFSVADVADYKTSFKDVSLTLVSFLEKFYAIFPEYRQRQLYISGESEAGTYIPYVANDILQMPEADRFNLGGLMIGNGWIDPYPMYMSYLDILRSRNLLDGNVEKKVLKLMDLCTREYNRAPQPVHTDVCERIPSVFLDEGGPSPGMCYNQYDLRLTDTQPACGMNWPPEVGLFTQYFNRKDVQRSINVPDGMAPAHWTECNNMPNTKLRSDTSPPAVSFMNAILDHIPVLLFVGKDDYMCNHIGMEWSISNLTWAGSTGFTGKSKVADWTIDGSVVGTVQSERGLTYALINDASHMVGVDRPREVLDLFSAFTNASTANLPFASSFRKGQDAPSPISGAPPLSSPDSQENTALVVGKWVGLCLLFVLALFFLLCFLFRKRLYSWWLRHRGYSSGSSDDARRRTDADGLVADRGRGRRTGYGRMLSEDELDDAFMMSEFAFPKLPKSRPNVDVEGLLLDDDPASSPDEDMSATATVRSTANNTNSSSPSAHH
ncbi:Cell death protease [Coemansia sp. RSA 2049]|nr:Cell death protease [Coemansia sp. RSA 1939]KAJ2521658.1 Cell death protease [Coemansia sp. RSA 2049]KAJ2611025.1 Cell death protease [Coemansia sp. RSA 1804]